MRTAYYVFLVGGILLVESAHSALAYELEFSLAIPLRGSAESRQRSDEEAENEIPQMDVGDLNVPISRGQHADRYNGCSYQGTAAGHQSQPHRFGAADRWQP